MPNPKVKLEDFVRKLERVSKIDWARLAAFIDGEGCITIASSPRRGRAARPQHETRFTINNTSPVLYDWLLSTFGGGVRVIHHKNVRPVYSWVLNELQVEQVIKRCLPYFIIKRRQAEIALAFRALKSRKRDTYHNRRLTDAEWNARDKLQVKIRKLNGARERWDPDSVDDSKEGPNAYVQ